MPEAVSIRTHTRREGGEDRPGLALIPITALLWSVQASDFLQLGVRELAVGCTRHRAFRAHLGSPKVDQLRSL